MSETIFVYSIFIDGTLSRRDDITADNVEIMGEIHAQLLADAAKHGQPWRLEMWDPETGRWATLSSDAPRAPTNAKHVRLDDTVALFDEVARRLIGEWLVGE